MNKGKIVMVVLSLLVSAGVVTATAACTGKEPSYEDRETFAKETYVSLEGTTMTFWDGLDPSEYREGTPEGDWLKGCSAPDRNDQIDAYVLRHESVEDGHTTFTYLVYYPHGGDALAVSPEVLEGGSGYVLNLAYAAGAGREGASLCYLSVTLPPDKAPMLNLLLDGEDLGILSTVTQTPITP